MLLLKRTIGDSTFIIVPPSKFNTIVEVKVVDIGMDEIDGGPRIRLGFIASPNVVIHRKEILERIAAGVGASLFPSKELAAEIVAASDKGASA